MTSKTRNKSVSSFWKDEKSPTRTVPRILVFSICHPSTFFFTTPNRHKWTRALFSALKIRAKSPLVIVSDIVKKKEKEKEKGGDH